MTRYEFSLAANEEEQFYHSIGAVEAQVQNYFGQPVFIDAFLEFLPQHFTEQNPFDFATYDNGFKKGGTLRYKAGLCRIPERSVIPLYEFGERKNGFPPRLFMTIPKIVLCHADELKQDELDMDGFIDREHMIQEMKQYYPDIRPDSIVSFYTFGYPRWTP